MSDPSPIYKNPMKWWSEHLAQLESKVQYMEEQGIPVPESDREMIVIAQNYVTMFVTAHLTDGESI